jgi:mercuric ion binding protein
MKIRILVGTLVLAAAGINAAFAAERTVTLAVDNMTCVTCPYTVKKALSRVPGVEGATVSFEQKTATITFDDAKADVEDLTAATTRAGYPSRLVEKKGGQGGRQGCRVTAAWSAAEAAARADWI